MHHASFTRVSNCACRLLAAAAFADCMLANNEDTDSVVCWALTNHFHSMACF